MQSQLEGIGEESHGVPGQDIFHLIEKMNKGKKGGINAGSRNVDLNY